MPFAETDPVPRQISPYAATKRAAELLAETYTRVYDFRAGILRFFTVFCPRQRPDLAIARFMGLIAAGKPVPMVGDGSTSRDYTCVDDVIDGVLAASAAIETGDGPFSRIWNLGHSHPVRLSDMIERIGRVIGRQPRIEQHPMQRGDVARTWADLTRSQAELEYEPRVDFEEGRRLQWQWMKSRRSDERRA